MKTPIKVGIAEDHALFRKGICDFLNSTGKCIIVLEKSSGENIVEALEKHEPDVLLLDLQMPEVDGFTALKEIRQKRPQQKVIIYSSNFSKKIGLSAFGDTIQDYLPKHSTPEELLKSIMQVYDG